MTQQDNTLRQQLSLKASDESGCPVFCCATSEPKQTNKDKIDSSLVYPAQRFLQKWLCQGEAVDPWSIRRPRVHTCITRRGVCDGSGIHCL